MIIFLTLTPLASIECPTWPASPPMNWDLMLPLEKSPQIFRLSKVIFLIFALEVILISPPAKFVLELILISLSL